MNDIEREEHRLAALAAGYHRLLGTCYKVPTIARDGVPVEWHPKTNKADSFDLMVNCNIIGGFSKIEQRAMAVHPYSWVECEYGGHDTPADDLMQAIFNCAAAVGRSMEASNEQAAD